MLVWAGIRTSDPRSRQSWDQWRVVGRQQAPIFRSRDLYGPFRGQYCVHMISIDKSEASIQYARGQLLHGLQHAVLVWSPEASLQILRPPVLQRVQ